MKCREIDKKLSLYLDGLLDREESEEIKEHLDTCERCTREFRELQDIKKTLGSLEPLKAPDSLLRSINESIDKENAAAGITQTIKKLFDYLSMRHAVEAAGVFAAAAIIVIVVLPSEKNTLPQMANVEEKTSLLDQKTLSKRDLKTEAPSPQAPVDKFAGTARKISSPKNKMKDSIAPKADRSPVLIAFSMNRAMEKSLPLELNAVDDESEELKVERKRSSRPAGMRSSKKSKSYAAGEYSRSAEKAADSESYMFKAPALKEKQARDDSPSKISTIARSFGASVKRLENKKVLEVTIKGARLKDFLKELRKIGSVRVMEGDVSTLPESVQVNISYEGH